MGTERLILSSELFLVSSKIGYILTGKYIDSCFRSCQQCVSSCLVITEVLPEMGMVSCSDDSIMGNTSTVEPRLSELIGEEGARIIEST